MNPRVSGDRRTGAAARVAAGLLAALLAACRGTGPAAPAPAGPPRRVAVAGRSPDARFVTLTDHSRWIVQPAGQGAVLRWAPGYPVQVVRTGRADWPFALIDPFNGNSALVRPAAR